MALFRTTSPAALISCHVGLETILARTHDLFGDLGRVRLVARPGAVTLDHVAQQYAGVAAGIGTDQSWAALRQWGAATLTGREGHLPLIAKGS